MGFGLSHNDRVERGLKKQVMLAGTHFGGTFTITDIFADDGIASLEICSTSNLRPALIQYVEDQLQRAVLSLDGMGFGGGSFA